MTFRAFSDATVSDTEIPHTDSKNMVLISTMVEELSRKCTI